MSKCWYLNAKHLVSTSSLIFPAYQGEHETFNNVFLLHIETTINYKSALRIIRKYTFFSAPYK